MGTIGGCREYTGAPFFASMSALKVHMLLLHTFGPHPYASSSYVMAALGGMNEFAETH